MGRPDISYQLFIAVSQRVTCRIGKLGTFSLPAGQYVYTGSARRALEARIARHLRQDKAMRWHIDYLLGTAGVTITEVWRSPRAECALNQAVEGHILAAGFGASDCHAGCGAHLKYLGQAPQAGRKLGRWR
jgi:Uri superfamily endonuclease